MKPDPVPHQPSTLIGLSAFAASPRCAPAPSAELQGHAEETDFEQAYFFEGAAKHAAEGRPVRPALGTRDRATGKFVPHPELRAGRVQ